MDEVRVDSSAHKIATWLEDRRVAAAAVTAARGIPQSVRSVFRIAVPLERGGYQLPWQERDQSPFTGDSRRGPLVSVYEILPVLLDDAAKTIAKGLKRKFGARCRFNTTMGHWNLPGASVDPALMEEAALGERRPASEKQKRGALTSVLVLLQLCVIEYLTALDRLDVPDPALAERLASELIQFLLSTTVELVGRIPVDGIGCNGSLAEGELRLTPLTPEEQGELFDRRWRSLMIGSRASQTLPLPFPSVLGVNETMVVEVHRQIPKVEPWDLTAATTATVLAMQLRAHELAGEDRAALISEPRWLSSVKLIRPVPLTHRAPNVSGPIDAAELNEVAALATKIETVLTEGPGKPAELALRRFGLGLSRRDDRDAVVDYTVALEAVLLPGKRGRDMVGPFSQHGAVYTESSVEAGKLQRKRFRRIYETRKMLVHGGSASELTKTLHQMPRIAALARKLTESALRRALEEGWPTEETFERLIRAAAPTE